MTLHVVVDDNLSPVSIDMVRIQQVLDNLMSNALRHTNEHGKITLSAQKGEGNIILIHVHNTGNPISSDHAEQIFNRFWRADEARERDAGGTGLGLAITKLLVELHDGMINAIPVSDGTVFEIQLPAE